MEEKLYQVALELIPLIGDVTAKNLIAYCGSASAIFKASQSQLKKIPGIGDKTISQIASADTLHEAEQIISQCSKKGIAIHHYTDPSYPGKLKQVSDAPNVIYSKGTINAWERTIAIVGTRNATEYGKAVTEQIVEEVKSLDAVVISGLAYGIDVTAHRAALANDIPTVGILAGGLDKIYPSLHKKTAEEMLETGGLISENPPGVEAEPHFFPARNRIIAGMSDVVIVVEAARKGGALITANIADSYNKVVFAVPGDLSNKYSEGCNYLIRNQKALIYTGVNDLTYHLHWEKGQNGKTRNTIDLGTLSDPERSLFKVLDEHRDGVAIDDLSWRAQLPVNQVATILLNLEFQGLVKSLPGKKYRVV